MIFVLKKSSLYQCALHEGLHVCLEARITNYFHVSWTCLKRKEHHSFLELLYNHKHKRGRSIVEKIIFGIIKLIFKELLKKIKLHITIVPNFLSAYCLFFNLILGRRKINVKELMQVIEMEAKWKMSTWCIEWIESKWNIIHNKGKELSKEQHCCNFKI